MSLNSLGSLKCKTLKNKYIKLQTVTNSTPVAGDIWYTAPNLNLRQSSSTVTISTVGGISTSFASPQDNSLIMYNSTSTAWINYKISFGFYHNTTLNSYIPVFEYVPDWTIGNHVTEWSLIVSYLSYGATESNTAQNKNTVVLYPTAYSLPANSIQGGVLTMNKRLYYVPTAATAVTQWYYIDVSNSIYSHVAYPTLAAIPASGYMGGVLSKQNNIFYCPYASTANSVWHYINGSTSIITSYQQSSITYVNGYRGGCLTSTGYVILAPSENNTSTIWHYINTNTTPPTVGTYQNTTGVASQGYHGCVINRQNRVFPVPYVHGQNTIWHYIDASVIPPVVYTYSQNSGYSVVYTNSYTTGVLDTNDRVYMLCGQEAISSVWLYVNTTATPPTVVSYSQSSGFTPSAVGSNIAYGGAVLSPDNMIVLTPATFGITYGLYITPTTPPVVYSYFNPHNQTIITSGYRSGAVLLDTGDIMMMPNLQTTVSYYHYIKTNTNTPMKHTLLTCPYYNKM